MVYKTQSDILTLNILMKLMYHEIVNFVEDVWKTYPNVTKHCVVLEKRVREV